MKKALRWLMAAAPFIELAAGELADLDENDEGADDTAAEFLSYVSSGLTAIKMGAAIPKAPASLR